MPAPRVTEIPDERCGRCGGPLYPRYLVLSWFMIPESIDCVCPFCGTGYPRGDGPAASQAIARGTRATVMLWFFNRNDESLRIETRYDNDASEVIAIVTYTDGRQRTERFGALEDFRAWLLAFERLLQEQHWTPRSGPIILPYGWPNKRDS